MPERIHFDILSNGNVWEVHEDADLGGEPSKLSPEFLAHLQQLMDADEESSEA
jgi:hypothetical protein